VIDAPTVLSALVDRGVAEVTGVPCSYLTPLINRAASDPTVRYLPVTQEGEAVAIAAGCWLAGVTACVIGQNSGLGNQVNPLTSLTYPSRIPVPLIITWRGEPGRPDEPQHELLGAVTQPLLELMRIGWNLLPDDPADLAAVLDRGWTAMAAERLPYAFILRQGVMAAERLAEPAPRRPVVPDIVRHEAGGAPVTRVAALEYLLGVLPDTAAIISTTGKTSRELFTLADRPQHFYLVGAMGSASAVGLGAARHTERPVVVIDGDGAALMRLGMMATVGAHPATNLIHILLDNQVHDSTGGQHTLAAQVDFPALAAACGYAQVHDCGGSLVGLGDAVKAAQRDGGPCLVYLRIRPGSLAGLGRPDQHPADVARRFRDFLTGSRP
jgi:phosphonopyruvate decarboxylase